MSQIKKYIENQTAFEKLPRQVLIENIHVYDPLEKVDEKSPPCIKRNRQILKERQYLIRVLY
jgi:hypothetical protein